VIRSRFPAKKTFGETFGAATGVSDPSYRRNRIRNRFFAAGSLLKKTFGETFGAATGVSDPRLQKKSGVPTVNALGG
jgi:hypothetical protein